MPLGGMVVDTILSFKNIRKTYGENVVLQDLSFDVHKGEIVALVGENGAGKSTLMNILFGMAIIPQTGGYSGQVIIDGKEVHFKKPQDAISSGIGMVHQEFMLIPGYSVMQNIKLNREPVKKNMFSCLFGKSFDSIDKEAMRRDAESALLRVGVDVDPEDKIAMLPVGVKQFVEICREVDKKNIKLLVFDEPTAVLTETEAEKLLTCLRSFAKEGIASIFISHRLDEVMSVSDRVVVLRDGVLVLDAATQNLDKMQIAEKLVGRSLAANFTSAKKRNISEEDVIMEFSDVSVDMPGEELKKLNLKVRRGEILGIGGLAGHGKIAVGNAVAGMYKSFGDILFEGQKVNVNNIGEALKHNIAFVSEDRKGVGLLLNRSITDNIVFTSMYQKKHFLKYFLNITQYDAKSSRVTAERFIKELEIKCMSADDIVGSLSGGNQQKVCMARILVTPPKLVFVSEPTRGIDIGAKKLILNYLQKINYEEGVTIVMVSSELNELRSICDRIAIISSGEIKGILPPDASNVDFALMMSGEALEEQGAMKADE